MQQLNEQECRQLIELMARAVVSSQMSLQVASPIDDGNACSSDDWRPEIVWVSSDDEPVRPEVRLLISDESACFLAGTTPEDADAKWESPQG